MAVDLHGLGDTVNKFMPHFLVLFCWHLNGRVRANKFETEDISGRSRGAVKLSALRSTMELFLGRHIKVRESLN